MKKIATIILAMCALLTQSCNSKNSKETAKEKVLVAYFSATGTTKAAAEKIQATTGGDIFEIEAEVPYTKEDFSWEGKDTRTYKEMVETPDFRPAMKTKLDDVSKYDVVYIGFPIWYHTAPTIINTFIENNNLEGKTIRLFCTSGSMTPKQALEEMTKKYPKLTFKDGKRMNMLTEKELKGWIEE